MTVPRGQPPRWNGDLKKKGLRPKGVEYVYSTLDGMETSKRRDCDLFSR